MKRSMAVVCSFFFLGASGILAAQAPVHGEQMQRIVTVSFTAAVLQSAEGQRESGALQTKYAPRQAQLQTLNSQVEALQKQISSDNKVTDSVKQTREKSLDTLEKQLQRQAEDFRNDTQADSQQVYQRVAQKMFTFLQDFAQQKGFAIVIDRGSDTAPVVWYAAKGVDITEDLIKAYNSHAETVPHSNSNGSAPAANAPESIPSAPLPH